MRNLYRLFRRRNVYYSENNLTGKQKSLRTQNHSEAKQILRAMNEAAQPSDLNRALGEAYLNASDPGLATRTWQAAMDRMAMHGRESTQNRCKREMASKPFNAIRSKVIVQTTADDFHAVLDSGGSSTNNYLRRLNNLAFDLGWLNRRIIPAKVWPKQRPKPKRSVTLEEHNAIVAAEKNTERRLYYELLWELGSAQTDTANLTADNLDWNTKVVSYRRQKLAIDSNPARVAIGPRLEALLKQLPSEGPLFPNIRLTSNLCSGTSTRCIKM